MGEHGLKVQLLSLKQNKNKKMGKSWFFSGIRIKSNNK